MCNRVDNSGLSLDKISKELRAEIAEEKYYTAQEVNAFSRPAIPVVLDHNGLKITHGTWGLYKEIPKDKPAKGINLTAENTYTYYKKFEQNRCLVPVSGFYDWMQVPLPGKKIPAKVKHRMHWKNEGHFYMGAFFDVWDNNEIGFGLVTTVANELMSVIHNSKLRMPIVMDLYMAEKFMSGQSISEFTYPAYDPSLIASNLEPEKMPATLFG